MVIYPAGLCSRRQPDGSIADLRWNKMFIQKAIETKRDIVPVHFEGLNSKKFYRTAHWRRKLGIKFNFEMILLPGEFCRSQSSLYKLTVGEPIPWQSLKGGRDAVAEAQAIRDAVYELPKQYPTK